MVGEWIEGALCEGGRPDASWKGVIGRATGSGGGPCCWVGQGGRSGRDGSFTSKYREPRVREE